MPCNESGHLVLKPTVMRTSRSIHVAGAGGFTPGPVTSGAATGFEGMYQSAVGDLLHGTGMEAFDAIGMLTTNYRDVIAELAQNHLGVRDVSRLFPNHRVNPDNYQGLLSA